MGLTRPEDCPENVWCLVLSCWTERAHRPTFVQIRIQLQEMRGQFSNATSTFTPVPIPTAPPLPPSGITIIVDIADGRTTEIVLDAQATVEEFNEWIHAVEGIEQKDQAIYFGGVSLTSTHRNDDKMLDYGLLARCL